MLGQTLKVVKSVPVRKPYLKNFAWREDERFPVAYGLSLFYKDCFLEDEKKSDFDLTLHYKECTTAKVEIECNGTAKNPIKMGG